jgi:hypothetical protein
VVSSSWVECPTLNPEDETTMLYLNVGHLSASDVAPHPRKNRNFKKFVTLKDGQSRKHLKTQLCRRICGLKRQTGTRIRRIVS